MKKTVKILGPGCTKCKKTEEIVRATVEKMGIDATVEKIEDITEIMKYNIITTPAVVVDEVVKIKGKIPKEKEIINILSE